MPPSGIHRCSFRSIVKRGRSLTVRSLWGGAGGIISLVPTFHTVFTSSKGEILAKEGEYISRKNCIIVLSNYALVNELGY